MQAWQKYIIASPFTIRPLNVQLVVVKYDPWHIMATKSAKFKLFVKNRVQIYNH